jgi:hypothetical protein
MPRALLIAAAAALSLGVAAPARADTQASATLSDILIRLVDLDPNDGITPSLTFLGNSDGTVSTTARSWGDPPNAQQSIRSSAAPFGAVSTTAKSTASGAAGTVAGDFFAGTGSLQAASFSGHAAFGTAVGFACIGDADGPHEFEAPFLLSPETALYITANGVVDATADDDINEYAYGIILMGNSGIEAGAGRSFLPPERGHYEGALAAQWVNDSTTPVQDIFTMVAYAAADSTSDAPPSTVPEPAGAALAGVGCLLLMATSRLRGRAVLSRSRR